MVQEKSTRVTRHTESKDGYRDSRKDSRARGYPGGWAQAQGDLAEALLRMEPQLRPWVEWQEQSRVRCCRARDPGSRVDMGREGRGCSQKLVCSLPLRAVSSRQGLPISMDYSRSSPESHSGFPGALTEASEIVYRASGSSSNAGPCCWVQPVWKQVRCSVLDPQRGWPLPFCSP